jgi:hypothetical protein
MATVLSGRTARFIGILFVVLVLGACSTRSISNSGYQEENYFGGKSAPENPFYQGELSEFDVLGIDVNGKITEQDIQIALEQSAKVTLKKGTKILLIQSGALIPDGSMIESMRKYYNTSTFSGVPSKQKGENYSKLLRLSAAKGGFTTIVVYWGLLETAQKGLTSKTISWVPFIGSVIPDEDQHMRINLKLALVDVKTGSWETFSPIPFDNTAMSSRSTRGAKDQKQIDVLKNKAYAAAVEELILRYSR